MKPQDQASYKNNMKWQSGTAPYRNSNMAMTSSPPVKIINKTKAQKAIKYQMGTYK